MSVWERISQFVSNAAGDVISGLAEAVRTMFSGDPETRRQVSFSVAIIALSAKMAKADGIVTKDEVDAFRELFDIPQSEIGNVSRLYNLARQDVAGFDQYARQVRNLFPDDPDILHDVLDGLFYIAKSDGVLHELELEFIRHVAGIFEVEGKAFRRLKLRHVHGSHGNAWEELGADPDWDDDTLKRHFRKLAAENHPDRMMARGVPPEFLKIANDRLAEINRAWDEIRAERGL
jgi:DnaJ like chaperone protein